MRLDSSLDRSKLLADWQVFWREDGLAAEGWLVMFDLREGLSWGEKITTRDVEHRGKRVHVVG